VVYGAQQGIGAAIVGVPAMVAQVLMMMTASRLVAETIGAAAKSRITLEVTAAQYGLFVAAMIVGWFVLPQPIFTGKSHLARVTHVRVAYTRGDESRSLHRAWASDTSPSANSLMLTIRGMHYPYPATSPG